MTKRLNSFFKAGVILLLGVFLCSKVTAQTVKVEANLKDFTIKIGDQTKLFLVVTQSAKEHVNFPALTDTITGKIQIVSTDKADTVVDQNDKNKITVRQGYTITSFDAGIHNFPAFQFGTASGVVKSNELTIQVQTVKIDTTKSIYDIKKPIIVTYTFIDWLKDNWMWILAGLVLICLIIGIIYYLRKRPATVPVVKVVKPTVPAHVTALNKLDALRAKKLWQQGQVKLYYSELTDIMREYLEQRYDIRTYEKTTDEILTSLDSRAIPAEYRNKLKQLLTLADLVKFAKLVPTPQENEESIEEAIAIVLNTKAVDETVGGSANEPV